MKVKRHNEEPTRGIRDPRKCKAQSGGRLVFLRNGIPYQWNNRPLKFRGHIRMQLGGRVQPVEITDIKWQQLGSSTWWRIPEWPDGNANSTEGS